MELQRIATLFVHMYYLSELTILLSQYPNPFTIL